MARRPETAWKVRKIAESPVEMCKVFVSWGCGERGGTKYKQSPGYERVSVSFSSFDFALWGMRSHRKLANRGRQAVVESWEASRE